MALCSKMGNMGKIGCVPKLGNSKITVLVIVNRKIDVSVSWDEITVGIFGGKKQNRLFHIFYSWHLRKCVFLGCTGTHPSHHMGHHSR